MKWQLMIQTIHFSTSHQDYQVRDVNRNWPQSLVQPDPIEMHDVTIKDLDCTNFVRRKSGNPSSENNTKTLSFNI